MFDGGKQRKKKRSSQRAWKNILVFMQMLVQVWVCWRIHKQGIQRICELLFFFLGTLVFMSVFWEFYRCSCHFKCLVSVGYRYLLEESSIICFLFIYLFCCGGNNISLEYRLALNYYLLLNLILSIINKYFLNHS